jgi:hypothetical protein
VAYLELQLRRVAPERSNHHAIGPFDTKQTVAQTTAHDVVWIFDYIRNLRCPAFWMMTRIGRLSWSATLCG